MTDPTPQPDPAVALAGRLTVVSWEEHERLCAIAVAREHHRMVARTADAAACLAVVEALLAKADRTDTACVPASRLRAALSATALGAVQREQIVLDFVQDIASNAAYNGSPGYGQVYYDQGINPWLSARAYDYLRSVRHSAPDAGQREAQERAEVGATAVLVCGNTCEHNHDSLNGPTGCCATHGPYMYYCGDCTGRADRETTP